MNNNHHSYRVAELDFTLCEPHFTFCGLKPFRIEEASDSILTLAYEAETRLPSPEMQLVDTFDFPDANADCHFYRYNGGHLLTMTVRHDATEVRFDIPDEAPAATCNFAESQNPSLFRFGLWVALNVRAVERGVVAIHSSVLIYNEAVVLCLGESGTGKSTHTRLWREHIEGTSLLNDDSPFVRITNDQAYAYGSPWSGKTPCYRNLSYPIRGFMRLSQGPSNVIRPLGVLQAYGALQPSCPPSFTHDDHLFDCVNRLLSALLKRTKAWHLSCLPNAEAAELARDTIFNTPQHE